MPSEGKIMTDEEYTAYWTQSEAMSAKESVPMRDLLAEETDLERARRRAHTWVLRDRGPDPAFWRVITADNSGAPWWRILWWGYRYGVRHDQNDVAARWLAANEIVDAAEAQGGINAVNALARMCADRYTDREQALWAIWQKWQKSKGY
jgi:hypothetical protein